jgi:thiamine-phosphate pyrophosphorylase
MDRQLLAWGMLGRRSRLPRLWLFTDERRLPDPTAAIAGLPRGRAGVVFRHDAAVGRAALARRVAKLCRERRLTLVVAGDPHLAAALGAGLHLRGGRRTGGIRPRGVISSSAHSAADLRRATRSGAQIVFLSPVFLTRSHPGADSLGPVRWGLLARGAPAGAVLAALGGIMGRNIRRLPQRLCHAAGAIGALGG